MLEQLDILEWAHLTHAYGKAVNVLGLIRTLASNDPEERRVALDSLFSNIWHQGTVYEATAAAVPFLVELLANPDVKDKHEILSLLAFIAEGRSCIDVPSSAFDNVRTGPRAEQERRAREESLARELEWVRAAREAVEAGVPVYLSLLSDQDPEVRGFAANTLGHCRSRAERVVPELSARAVAERNPA